MTDTLAKSNIYFNEVDKISILKPEVSKITNNLKDECQIYVEKIDEFHKISERFIEIVERFSREVEKQKMKAIGARNFLQCMEKQRENNYQQLQAISSEKTLELEKLMIQLNYLQKTELEQNEIINQLTNY